MLHTENFGVPSPASPTAYREDSHSSIKTHQGLPDALRVKPKLLVGPGELTGFSPAPTVAATLSHEEPPSKFLFFLPSVPLPCRSLCLEPLPSPHPF